MRRVDCRHCHVVEEVPWGDGKRTLTRTPRWARKLPWKETAESFAPPEKRSLTPWSTWSPSGWNTGYSDQSTPSGDEIQYGKGHKYLTLVYQIDPGVTRLLWVGRERTIESFRGFFASSGDEVASTASISSPR
jgi:transposase